jgi:hypothetical protein
VVPRGSPKYVKGIVSTRQPSVPGRILTFSSPTLIGTIKDMLKLTLRPIDYPKLSSKHFRKNSCLASTCIMIRVSSAYCTIGKACPNELSIGNWIMFWWKAWLTILCKRSVAKTKRRGDRGPLSYPMLAKYCFPWNTIQKNLRSVWRQNSRNPM